MSDKACRFCGLEGHDFLDAFDQAFEEVMARRSKVSDSVKLSLGLDPKEPMAVYWSVLSEQAASEDMEPGPYEVMLYEKAKSRLIAEVAVESPA